MIIGHSERRDYFKETDEMINKKVLKAFEHGITPIICCGESLTQRKQGIDIDGICMQMKIAFQGVTADQAKTAAIAYERSGQSEQAKTATSESGAGRCAAIRTCISPDLRWSNRRGNPYSVRRFRKWKMWQSFLQNRTLTVD